MAIQTGKISNEMREVQSYPGYDNKLVTIITGVIITGVICIKTERLKEEKYHIHNQEPTTLTLGVRLIGKYGFRS